MEKADGYFWVKNKYLRHPRYLQLEITNRCVLDCPQCYKNPLDVKDMDLQLMRKILNEAEDIGVTTVYLNGGEPFLHHEIDEILDMLSCYHFKVYCFSSGIGITQEKIEKIRGIKEFYLTISLNGSTEAVNKLSRDGYEVSVGMMKELGNLGFPYGVNWVCRQDNVYDFENLVTLAKNLKASWINISANKLTGRGEIVSPIGYKEYLYLKDYIEKMSDEDKKYIRVQYCYNLLNDMIERPLNRRLSGCNAGVLVCCCNVDGLFMPCTHLYYPEKFESISDYWKNSQTLKALRDVRVKKEKCTGCDKVIECHFCKALSPESYSDFNEDLHNCPLKRFYQEGE